MNNIAEKILPDENFFAYKFNPSCKDKHLKELNELKRINIQASQHGSHKFINNFEALLKPV